MPSWIERRFWNAGTWLSGGMRRHDYRALVYELQVKVFGGLPARTRRALRAAAKADGRSTLSKLPSRGTRLVRAWHGALHEVEVLDDGYLWRGERHRSLSAIARAITGAKWSGPRFFGLMTRP